MNVGFKNDLTGRRFTKLLVVGYSDTVKKNSYWNCLCDCGVNKRIRGNSLVRGETKSCGCWKVYVDKTRCALPLGEAVFNYLYDDIKRRAQRKATVCTLSKQEFRSVITGSCHYCGTLPKERRYPNSNGYFLANGIDRVDNKVGYVLSNCVPCCETCNMMKREHGVDSWLSHMARILEYYQPEIPVGLWTETGTSAAQNFVWEAQ